VLEVLIEYLLSLVHDLFTHDDEKLSSFKGSFGADAEIVRDDLDDGFLLAGIVSEFVQNGSQGSRCGAGNCGDAIFAEFKEHWQELREDDSVVEK